MGLAMVSVLLAAYNGEAYLPELLASLEGQQYRDFRILWQDDGSGDGSAALLTRYAGTVPCVPAAAQGQHLGAAGNFLSLMAQDTAPYSALCDQDDVWHADRLSRCIARMQEAERTLGADTPILVHSDARLTGSDGRLLHGSFFRHQGWDPSAVTLPRLLVQNNATGCTMLINAPLRRLVCSHAEADKLFMHDWFIALTAAAFGRVCFIDAPLVDYRQHGSNALGASRHGLLRRGLSALTAPQKARERIALSYRHARMFRDACGNRLPDDARQVIDAYLAAEHLPKLQRVAACRRGGFTMQSPIARIGQILFG